MNYCIRTLYVFAAALLALAVDALLPGQALAWGPGVHMVVGNWLLQNLAALPVGVAAALMEHPGQFLHGSLSADIFIGKGCKAKKGHSHNWESGFTLLERARSMQQRAYAYGYLAHLAADTVAHNVFVPGLFHTAPGPGKLAHVYLEAQADRLLDWDTADALGVFKSKAGKRADRLLRRSMNKPSLVFGIQSRLFRSSIALCGSAVWRGSMRLVDSLLPMHERAAILHELMAVSARAAFNVLQSGQDSPVLQLDPIGAGALARMHRRRPGPALAPDSMTLAPDTTGTAPTGAAPGIFLPPVLARTPPLCSPFSP